MSYKVFRVVRSTFVLSIEILISILLSVFIVPVGLTVTLINELARLITAKFLRFKYGNGPGRITLSDEGADNIWSYRKPNNGRMCLAVLFCENPINLEQQRKLYMSRVINHTTKHGRKPYQKLRKILTTMYGYNCHKLAENFDIQNHVRIWQQAEHEDVVVDESQLMNEILPALFKDMDESKPQWEEVIIPKFRHESLTSSALQSTHGNGSICSVRVLRYHHGIMDGASNLLLWTACMTEDQGASFPYAVNPLVDSGRVSKCQRFLYDLSCVILCAFIMVKSIINAGRLKSRFVTVKYTGKRNFGWSEMINVEMLRRIKATCKVTVPAMLTTAIGGALRKLNEKFPNSEYGNPEEIIMGLVSALIPYANHSPRNQFTVVHFPVLTGATKMNSNAGEPEDCSKMKFSSNLQRLHETNRSMVRIGRDPIVYLNYFMFKYFGRFPASIVQGLMENGGLPVVFSNVPVSTETVQLWGNTVLTAAGWPPLLTNTGLGIVTMRYADHVRFCAVSDEACMSPEALNYFLQEAATELKALADECSDFETVVHKSEKNGGISSVIDAPDSAAICNSYISPKISTVTMDFRRGSFPSQILETVEY